MAAVWFPCVAWLPARVGPQRGLAPSRPSGTVMKSSLSRPPTAVWGFHQGSGPWTPCGTPTDCGRVLVPTGLTAGSQGVSSWCVSGAPARRACSERPYCRQGSGGAHWVLEPVLSVTWGPAGSYFSAWCLVQDSSQGPHLQE